MSARPREPRRGCTPAPTRCRSSRARRMVHRPATSTSPPRKWSPSARIAAPSERTHSTRSSRRFHTRPSVPPARRTRPASAEAAETSTQCHACAYTMASAEASGSGIRSPVPCIASTVGSARRSVLEHARRRFHSDHATSEALEQASELAGTRSGVDDGLRPRRRSSIARIRADRRGARSRIAWIPHRTMPPDRSSAERSPGRPATASERCRTPPTRACR